MRSKQKPASLAELIGKSADEEMELEDLPKILGEKLPELPRNKIGKFRLGNALKLRFGPGYKNIPGIKNLLKEFDEEIETESIISRNKGSRNG